MSANGWKMGREVGLIVWTMAKAVGCQPCGIGIAVDLVGRRWGEEPYDWRANHNGHDCENIRNGLTPQKQLACEKIASSLRPSPGDEVQVPIDTRLPPEPDDEVPF